MAKLATEIEQLRQLMASGALSATVGNTALHEMLGGQVKVEDRGPAGVQLVLGEGAGIRVLLKAAGAESLSESTVSNLVAGGRFELYSVHPIQVAAVPASLKA